MVSNTEAFAFLLLERIAPAECRVTTQPDEQVTRQAIRRALGEELPRQCNADEVVQTR